MTAERCGREALRWLWIATLAPFGFAVALGVQFIFSATVSSLLLLLAVVGSFALTVLAYRKVKADLALEPDEKTLYLRQLRWFGPAATVDVLIRIYKK